MPDPDVPLQPWWRTALWLSLWLILPAYGFYCISTKGFVAPWDFRHALDPYVLHWSVLSLQIGLLILLCILWRPAAKLLALAVPAYLLFKLSAAFFQTGLTDPAAAFGSWCSTFTEPALPAAAIALSIPAIWSYCAPTFSQRVLKTFLLAGVCAAVFAGLCLLWAGIWFYTHHRFEIEWSIPGKWAWAHPMRWKLVDRTYDFHSVWMPRYLGIAWPAFAIAVSVLLLRLPTRGLRWSVIALLLLVNTGNAVARVWIDPEPPAALAATDVAAERHPNSDTRTLIQGGGGQFFLDDVFSPGNAWIAMPFGTSPVGRYWLSVTGVIDAMPADFSFFFGEQRSDRAKRPPAMIRPYLNPAFVALGVRHAADINRLIAWERSSDPLPTDDAMLNALGPTWRVTSDRSWRAYDHWSWRHTCDYRRRVYERIPAAGPARR